MNRYPPTHTDELSPDSRRHWFTGSALEMGILLGSIHNEQSRQTEILLGVLDEIRDAPDRLASKLQSEKRQLPMLLEVGAKMFELLKEVSPILAIGGAALAKYLGFDLGLSGP